MQQVKELNTESVRRDRIIGRPRVGSFGLFAVCLMLLCLQTHGQTEESPSTLVDGQEIFMEKSVPTKRGHTEHLFIRYSQQLYVEAIGEGAIIIKAYRSSATELELDGTPKQILIRDFTVYTYGSTICWIWNVNPVDVNALEIVTVKISIDGPPRASIAPVQAKLARSSL